MPILFAIELKIDAGLATVITAFFVLVSSTWQSWMLNRVHTLVNSNFSEAKAARSAAETALKIANDLNSALQLQLDRKNLVDVIKEVKK